jgi:hypothetical protein
MTLKIRNINVRMRNLREKIEKVVSILVFIHMLLKSFENTVCSLPCAGLIPAKSRHRERNFIYNESFLHIRGFDKSRGRKRGHMLSL